MGNNNIAEALFKSIDLIAEKNLQNLTFDKTVRCTIVDAYEANNGLYIVTDGSTKFEAYTTDTSLKENEEVYVTIPQGDYNSQKLIVSKAVAKDKQAITWIPPGDAYIPIETLFTNGNEKETGLLANGLIQNILIGNTLENTQAIQEASEEFFQKLLSLDKTDAYYQEKYNAIVEEFNLKVEIIKNSPKKIANQSGFKKLCISADFRTWLQSKDFLTIDGTYGLKIYIKLYGSDMLKVIYFTSDEMWGNPFKYEDFFTQEKVFDISDWGEIEYIDSIEFFQGPQDIIDNTHRIFIDENEEPIPYQTKGDMPMLLPNNLFVKNINISIGYGIDEVGEDSVFLYTTGDVKFDFTPNETAKQNERTIKSRWIHKDGSSYRCIDAKAELQEGETLYWYRYDNQDLDKDPDELIKAPGWTKYRENETKNCFEITINDFRYNKVEEKFRAIVVWKDAIGNKVVTKSAELVFTNKRLIVEEDENALVLTFTYDDNAGTTGNSLNGKYYLYNSNAGLNDPKGAEIIRKVTAVINENAPGTEEEKTTNPGKIVWDFPPREASMIEIIGTEADYNTNGENKGSLTVSYRIKSNYSASLTENTIKCKIIRDQYELNGNTTMEFGQTDICGTGLYAKPIIYNKEHVAVPAVLEGSTGNYILIIPSDQTMENILLTAEQTKSLPDYKDAQTEKIEVKYDKFLAWKYPIANGDFGKLKVIEGTFNEKKFGINVPIPVRSHENLRMSGAREVSYSENGGNPSYSKESYKLFLETKEEATGMIAIDEMIPNTTLSGTGYPSGVTDSKFYPVLEIVNSAATNQNKISLGLECRLLPKPLYTSNTVNDTVITLISKDNKYKYVQPINIEITKYGISVLNEWDGNLTIDEENGIILSSMIGAGKKDDKNTFTGVLMGEVSSRYGENKLGLYGYHKDEQSFGFNIDGTAFIGKSGLGRIYFDGTQGIIENGGFAATKKDGSAVGFGTYYTEDASNSIENVSSGVRINFIEGALYSAKGVVGGWSIGKDSLSKPYMYTYTDASGKEIQTKMYAGFRAPGDATQGTTAIVLGTTQDLQSNTIPDGAFKTAPFRVTYGGELFSTAGKIGGWNITEESLYFGNSREDTSDGAIALSTTDFERVLTVDIDPKKDGAQSPKDLRFAIGSNFGVSKNGHLYAKDAILSGSIYSDYGEIGGWIIEKGYLWAQKENGLYTTIKANDSVAIGIGSPTASDTTGAKIQLWHDGTAKFGNISKSETGEQYGLIVETNGNIRGIGWSVTNKGDAQFDNLNINKSATINGNINMYGNMNLGTSGNIYSSKTKLSISSGNFLFSGGTVSINSTLKVNGSTTIGGNLSLGGSVSLFWWDDAKQYTTTLNGSQLSALNRGYRDEITVKVDAPGWFDGSASLTFYNGILIGFKGANA